MPVGGDFLVGGETNPSFGPVVDGTPGNDFALVWNEVFVFQPPYGSSPGTDQVNPDLDFSIQGRWYLPDGTPVDEQFQINSYTTGTQGGPAVTSGDSFLVLWSSYGSYGTDPDWSIQGKFLESPLTIFISSFESGDTTAWSSTQ